MNRNWSCRDKCLVWWRDDSEEGGNLWEGRIVSLKDKSSDFPGSPWERCVISYKSDPTNTHCHSPWELHDPDCLWVHPQVDADKRNRILSYFDRLLQSASTDQVFFLFCSFGCKVVSKVKFLIIFSFSISGLFWNS